MLNKKLSIISVLMNNQETLVKMKKVLKDRHLKIMNIFFVFQKSQLIKQTKY